MKADYEDFIPILIIFTMVSFPDEFIYLSYTTLGKLFAVFVIAYYTAKDPVYGIFVCAIVLLYYHMDFDTGMRTILKNDLLREAMEEAQQEWESTPIAIPKTNIIDTRVIPKQSNREPFENNNNSASCKNADDRDTIQTAMSEWGTYLHLDQLYSYNPFAPASADRDEADISTVNKKKTELFTVFYGGEAQAKAHIAKDHTTKDERLDTEHQLSSKKAVMESPVNWTALFGTAVEPFSGWSIIALHA